VGQQLMNQMLILGSWRLSREAGPHGPDPTMIQRDLPIMVATTLLLCRSS